MPEMNSKFYLCLKGKNHQAMPYAVTLGPWTKKEDAQAWSDHLANSRIGEQMLMKFGVEEVIVQEA